MPLPQPATGAGDLRERVAFEYRAYSTDGYGNEQAAAWTEAFNVAAQIKPARGAESIQAARLAGKQPVVITVRVSTNTKMVRVEWRARDVRSGVIYNIRSIVNSDERRIFFDLECDTGVAV